MRSNLPVTGIEKDYPDHYEIISATDLKGVITHVNDRFTEVCGFSSDELMGKAHNIVRHPDVPPAAFADLWNTIGDGRPWMGIVKNRCKSGDHYWVDAYVAPLFDNGRISGYESVRVKPERALVNRADKLYARIREGRRLVSRMNVGIKGRVFSCFLMLLLPLCIAAIARGAVTWIEALFLVPLLLMASHILARVALRPLSAAAADARKVVDNPVMQLVYTGRADEIGQIRLALRMQNARTRTILGRTAECARRIEDATEVSSSTFDKLRAGADRQCGDLAQVAVAMNEMVAAVRDVARNTAHAADAGTRAHQETEVGCGIITETSSKIEELARKAARATESIERLCADTAGITVVLDVIRDITDQTNLLALNAAIEAARAGDKGRGFAVVAGEVRALARRTQESAQQIYEMVKRLQDGAESARGIIAAGHKESQIAVRHVEKARKSLEDIAEAVTAIRTVTMEISSATEEQSATAEEINRNVGNINGIAEQNAEMAKDTTRLSADLAHSTRQLRVLVERLR